MDIITAHEFANLMNKAPNLFILDVRGPDEFQEFNIGGTLIPLNELPLRMGEIPQDIPIVVVCRSGHRSHIAQELLKSAGFTQVKNLSGGLLALQRECGDVN